MTRTDACKRAAKLARTTGKPHYVVWSVEDGEPGQHYHVATEWDIETFFDGCPVEAVFWP